MSMEYSQNTEQGSQMDTRTHAHTKQLSSVDTVQGQNCMYTYTVSHTHTNTHSTFVSASSAMFQCLGHPLAR